MYFQVISGASNDNDVQALFWDAKDREIDMVTGVTNFFEHESVDDGAVRICFRNLQSFKNLWVYFEVNVDRADDDDDDFDDMGAANKEAQKAVIVKYDQMKKKALSIHQKLT
ncbi:hypothetical protein SARC_15609, partial [Sphaeroforma arctica JP610]